MYRVGDMTDSAFDTPQYRKVKAICKVRDKFPTQAWIPDDSEEFIAEVLKTELGDSLEKIEDGVAVGFEQHTEAMKQQSELIERWVEQEEKRLPPKPPKSPFT